MMKRARDYFVLSAILLLLGVAIRPEVQHLLSGIETQKPKKSAELLIDARFEPPSSKRERVIQLPEDAENWYLTLFYRDRQRDVASIQLAQMFNENVRLNHLMQQVHFNKFQPGDPLYQSRYAAVLGRPEILPAVILQQPNGRVCYKASGTNIPGGADLLADELAVAIADCRPRPRPEPLPTPTPLPTPVSVPDLRPSPTANNSFAAAPLLMVIVPLLAGGLGVYQEWKRTNGG